MRVASGPAPQDFYAILARRKKKQKEDKRFWP
jgi:hypothetical protein